MVAAHGTAGSSVQGAVQPLPVHLTANSGSVVCSPLRPRKPALGLGLLPAYKLARRLRLVAWSDMMERPIL